MGSREQVTVKRPTPALRPSRSRAAAWSRPRTTDLLTAAKRAKHVLKALTIWAVPVIVGSIMLVLIVVF